MTSSSMILEYGLYKEASILSKESFVYSILCFMPISCSDLKDFVFNIFRNYCCQLNFAVVFRVNDGKYENILLAAVLANYPRCFSE